MRKSKILIVIVFLVFCTRSLLQAYMPVEAVRKLNDPINYTLANFGHILYGRTIIGELIVPKNQQFCNLDQITNMNISKKEDIKKFFLIKRGTCKFTKKISNAQKKGADMVIVYDNQPSTFANIIMSNDGFGHLINIPSIFVSSIDGQKILNTYKECKEKLIFKIYFDVYTSKVVNVTFWLDASNRQTFITIKDFYKDYYEVLRKHININLKYKINQNCGVQQCQSKDCIKNNQQYCLPVSKIIQGNVIQGKQYIYEQLREYYLFEYLKQKDQLQNWFKYMIEFDQNLCTEKLDLKQCSIDIISKYAQVEKIQKSITTTQKLVNMNQSNILLNFVEDAFTADILFYPEASINGRNFYGLFRAPDIFEMICQSLQKQPSQCYSFNKDHQKEGFGFNSSTGLWKTILLIILFMVILFFVILFIYNRLIRRQLNQQMSVEVNKMVEHYVAMTQQKSRSHASIQMK